MSGRVDRRLPSVCALLCSLAPGGSTWQWVRLLEQHVAGGGRATIVAGGGALAGPARAAGIEVVPGAWGEGAAASIPWGVVGEHDVAVVQWEQGVMEAFPRALEACGRAALSLHGSPQGITRWLAPPTPAIARRELKRAVREPGAVAMVRGEAHKRKVAAYFAVPGERLRLLPVSVPLRSLPFRPAPAEPREILALTRLGPEKAPVVRVAAELVRVALSSGRPCRLTIAGDGPWRSEALALCEQRLPPGSWRFERAPANSIARLSASDLVVAQGTTTLEAAALGRRVVVARSLGAHEASGAVLTPHNYDEAARDPFGDPRVSEDAARLWEEALAVDEAELGTLRQLVEQHNGPAVASRELDEALAATET